MPENRSKDRTIDPAKILESSEDEQFAQLVASGSTKSGAYKAVWGKSDRAHAYRKGQIPRIYARIEWLRSQTSLDVIEKVAEATTEIIVAAIERQELTRTYVIDTLMQNIAICMGTEKVKVEKQVLKADGTKERAIAYVTMRDAGAANKALEMLGKEIGLFEGEGKRDSARDQSEKAPIRTMSDEKAVTFLERYRDKRTPAAILGRKFRQETQA